MITKNNVTARVLVALLSPLIIAADIAAIVLITALVLALSIAVCTLLAAIVIVALPFIALGVMIYFPIISVIKLYSYIATGKEIKL